MKCSTETEREIQKKTQRLQRCLAFKVNAAITHLNWHLEIPAVHRTPQGFCLFVCSHRSHLILVQILSSALVGHCRGRRSDDSPQFTFMVVLVSVSTLHSLSRRSEPHTSPLQTQHPAQAQHTFTHATQNAHVLLLLLPLRLHNDDGCCTAGNFHPNPSKIYHTCCCCCGGAGGGVVHSSAAPHRIASMCVSDVCR